MKSKSVWEHMDDIWTGAMDMMAGEMPPKPNKPKKYNDKENYWQDFWPRDFWNNRRDKNDEQ